MVIPSIYGKISFWMPVLVTEKCQQNLLFFSDKKVNASNVSPILIEFAQTFILIFERKLNAFLIAANKLTYLTY